MAGTSHAQDQGLSLVVGEAAAAVWSWLRAEGQAETHQAVVGKGEHAAADDQRTGDAAIRAARGVACGMPETSPVCLGKSLGGVGDGSGVITLFHALQV